MIVGAIIQLSSPFPLLAVPTTRGWSVGRGALSVDKGQCREGARTSGRQGQTVFFGYCEEQKSGCLLDSLPNESKPEGKPGEWVMREIPLRAARVVR